MVDIGTAVLVDALSLLIVVLGAVVVENRFGLRKRVHVLWHKLVNTETHFKVDARYRTDLDFENVTDELKSVVRELHGNIEVIDDHKHELVVEVDDNFLITLTDEDDTLLFETSKLTSTMRAMRPEINELLHLLDLFEQRNHDQIKNTGNTFEDDTFTAELFLPYNSTFVNVYLPRGVTIKTYQLSLDYPDYDCTIEDTGDAINVSTTHRDDLKTILNRLLRIWAVWWHRMR